MEEEEKKEAVIFYEHVFMLQFITTGVLFAFSIDDELIVGFICLMCWVIAFVLVSILSTEVKPSRLWIVYTFFTVLMCIMIKWSYETQLLDCKNENAIL